MIQRKQTLYLLAALIVTIVCLCLPIASLKASGMEPDSIVTNLWIRSNAGISFFVSPLFVLLLLTCPLTFHINGIRLSSLCLLSAHYCVFPSSYGA